MLKDEELIFSSVRKDEALKSLHLLNNIIKEKERKKNLIIEIGKKVLNEKEKEIFLLISEYLALKGEMNETHPIYRGIIFLRIARAFASEGLDANSTNIPVAIKILHSNSELFFYRNIKKLELK